MHLHLIVGGGEGQEEWGDHVRSLGVQVGRHAIRYLLALEAARRQ